MDPAGHFGFIAASYCAAIAVVGGLIAWIGFDYRAQCRKLAELEKRGVTRRSDAAAARRPIQQAEKDA
jgi:heme exporter protein D